MFGGNYRKKDLRSTVCIYRHKMGLIPSLLNDCYGLMLVKTKHLDCACIIWSNLTSRSLALNGASKLPVHNGLFPCLKQLVLITQWNHQYNLPLPHVFGSQFSAVLCCWHHRAKPGLWTHISQLVIVQKFPFPCLLDISEV